MDWMETATKKCDISELLQYNQFECCCGVMEVGAFDDFEHEWLQTLDEYYEETYDAPRNWVHQWPVQTFYDALSKKNRNKLYQYALEHRLRNLFKEHNKNKMYIATTVQYQPEAAAALTNTGFVKVGEKLGAYRNTISVWLKQ